jgi:hypothetical protein
VRGTLDTEAGGVVTVQHVGPALVIGADEPAGAGRLLVMPAEFPAYEKLFVLDPAAHSVVADRDELVGLVEPSLGADLLRLTISRGRLRVDDREMAATYDGPELTVGLHPAFAHYAISVAIGAEVMIDVTEVVKPVVFRSATDSSFICMVMPIRLEDPTSSG